MHQCTGGHLHTAPKHHPTTSKRKKKSMVWLDQPCGSYDFKVPFTKTIRKPWKDTGLLLIRPGNYTAHLEPHSEAPGKEDAGGPGFCFIWVRVGPRVTLAHALPVNLKQKSGNLKFRKRKQVAQKVSIEINSKSRSGSSVS